MNARHQDGFSLIELAVVIAIIGLLVGGVLGGQALIQSAKLNRVLTDANQYAESIKNFRQRFEYLPGDFPTATQVWGRADGGTPIESNCTAPDTTASTGSATCNGNGNGEIDKWTPIEHWRAWQHLAAAGLIKGSYTGVAGSGGVDHVLPGVNTPPGPLPNTAYWLHTWSYQAANSPAGFPTGINPNDYSLVMAFGAIMPNDWNYGGALTGAEARSIDRKADDGLPATGTIRVAPYSPEPCFTGTTAVPGEYNVSSTGRCAIIFILRKTNNPL